MFSLLKSLPDRKQMQIKLRSKFERKKISYCMPPMIYLNNTFSLTHFFKENKTVEIQGAPHL